MSLRVESDLSQPFGKLDMQNDVSRAAQHGSAARIRPPFELHDLVRRDRELIRITPINELFAANPERADIVFHQRQLFETAALRIRNADPPRALQMDGLQSAGDEAAGDQSLGQRR